MKLLPVTRKQGSYGVELENGDRVALYRGEQLVANVGRGWRPDSALKIADLGFVLLLVHHSGTAGGWYFDAQGRFLHNDVTLIPPLMLQLLASVVRDGCRQIFERCDLPTQAVEVERSAFRDLHSTSRLYLYDLFVGDAVFAPSRVFEGRAGEAIGGEISDGVSRLFQKLSSSPPRVWQDAIIARDTSLEHADLQPTHSLVLNDFLCAYRMQAEGGAVWVLACEHYFAPVSIWQPSSATLLVWNSAGMGCSQLVVRHLIEHGDDVIAYLESKPQRQTLILRESHIGHHLWNELTGLDRLCRNGLIAEIEDVVVFNAKASEMFGLLEDIFGDSFPYVERSIVSIGQLARHVYRMNSVGIRATDIRISQVLAEAIAAVSEQPERRCTSVDAALELRKDYEITVIFGLRVENRAWVRQREGFVELVRQLAGIGKTLVIVDGHNCIGADQRGGMYASFNEVSAAIDPLDVEREIASALKEAAAAIGADFVDNVGGTVADSITWVQKADFFVTSWGAGLAKYKWIANKPGIVLTGKWNLANRRDLMIYDEDCFREHARASLFIDEAAVVDLPDAFQVVPVEGLASANFDVDDDELARSFTTLVNSCRKTPEALDV